MEGDLKGREPRSAPATEAGKRKYYYCATHISCTSIDHPDAVDATLVAELESACTGGIYLRRASYGSSFVPVPFQASRSIAL